MAKLRRQESPRGTSTHRLQTRRGKRGSRRAGDEFTDDVLVQQIEATPGWSNMSAAVLATTLGANPMDVGRLLRMLKKDLASD